MAEKTYRWASAYDWLEEAAAKWEGSEVFNQFLEMAQKLGNDVIQEMYQSDMDSDGFFTAVEEDEDEDDDEPKGWEEG